jgi:hypothetical protein
VDRKAVNLLPDPKKVANFLNRTLFKPAEQRRQEEETNRQVKIRLGMTRIRRHLSRQRDLRARLLALAKRALALNDQERFRQIGHQILQIESNLVRWEKFLLSLEVLEAQNDRVRATVDFIETLQTLSESLAETGQSERMAQLQMDLEANLARAASVEERLEAMMETIDGALTGDVRADEGALQQLERELSEQIAQEEARAFDPQIEQSLQKIRQELEAKDR